MNRSLGAIAPQQFPAGLFDGQQISVVIARVDRSIRHHRVAIETPAVWESPQDFPAALVKSMKAPIPSTSKQFVSTDRKAAAQWHRQRPHPLRDATFATK